MTKHHLDKRAGFITIDGPDDQLLTTEQAAELLGMSAAALRKWRIAKPPQGPRVVKLTPRTTRYRLGDIRAWLRERREAALEAYNKPKKTEVADAAE